VFRSYHRHRRIARWRWHIRRPASSCIANSIVRGLTGTQYHGFASCLVVSRLAKGHRQRQVAATTWHAQLPVIKNSEPTALRWGRVDHGRRQTADVPCSPLQETCRTAIHGLHCDDILTFAKAFGWSSRREGLSSRRLANSAKHPSVFLTACSPLPTSIPCLETLAQSSNGRRR
jgi:hypothetical protein